MQYIWISTLAFGICISMCDAACYFVEPEVILDSEGFFTAIAACVDDDGTRHSLKTNWKRDCMVCSCNSAGRMECCTNYATPGEYDKDDCESIFDKDSCSYSVVKKNNPFETCEVASYIG
ncbi:beta-microseminoprotein-like isoform X2 [Rhinatrema bivittatum]|uniref:beta-microseminoprotein-like isoform X1 n=1 Tax=Rhinatrema bivittatum TaxID=194408 RepID=UPI00112B5FE5|nr:beta-microseminoprotein-like isoform X1 [Rhinatrema bivittatum]XP_029464760.1 beta-microseminoprotein-like isoform X2 [Rhinatrema bivittatum]